MLAAWYADNREVYAEFREMVDKAINEGDMRIHEEVIGMLRSFVPDNIEQEMAVAIDEFDKEMMEECSSLSEIPGPDVDEQEEEADEDSIPEDADYPSVMEALDSAMEEVARQVEDEYNQMVVEMQPEIKTVENVIAEKIRVKDRMVFCYYYWMILDNGPTDMATIYSNHLRSNHVGLFWRWIFRLAFKVYVVYSFKMGARRMDWKKFLRKLDDVKARDDINKGLQMAMPGQSQGKRVDCRRMDELVANPNVIELIGLFLEKRKSDVEIAHLLVNLQLNGLVPGVAYTTFHRALQNAFPDAGIKGHGKAQAKYNELKRLYGKEMREVFNTNTTEPCSLSLEKQKVEKLKVEALDVYFRPYRKKDPDGEKD